MGSKQSGKVGEALLSQCRCDATGDHSVPGTGFHRFRDLTQLFRELLFYFIYLFFSPTIHPNHSLPLSPPIPVHHPSPDLLLLHWLSEKGSLPEDSIVRCNKSRHKPLPQGWARQHSKGKRGQRTMNSCTSILLSSTLQVSLFIPIAISRHFQMS